MSGGTGTCHVPLPDGQWMVVQVTALPLAGDVPLAAFKLADAGPLPVQERLRELLTLTRLAEHPYDARWRTHCRIEPAPAASDTHWELAAVLADRMARGVFKPAAPHLVALGTASNDTLGALVLAPGFVPRLAVLTRHNLANSQVVVAASPAMAPTAPVDSLTSLAQPGRCADFAAISHLSGLAGHGAPQAAVRSQRVWFPTVVGEVADRLLWVEVAVRPVPDEASAGFAGTTAPEPIDVLGLPATHAGSLRKVLEDARFGDAKGLGRWQTVVRFQRETFHFNSCDLALVMADRMARGRDPVPAGRLLATGSSSNWRSGRVESVGGMAGKLQLMEQQLQPGDRLLLPEAWRSSLLADYQARIRRAGGSCGLIAQLPGVASHAALNAGPPVH